MPSTEELSKSARGFMGFTFLAWSTLVFFILAAAVMTNAQTPSQLALAFRSNVVNIEVTHNNEQHNGLGIIVGIRDGKIFIATVNHLLRGSRKEPGEVATQINLRYFGAPMQTYPAGLLPMREEHFDLAVLQAEAPETVQWQWEALGSDKRLTKKAALWIGSESHRNTPVQAGELTEMTADFKLRMHNMPVGNELAGAPLIAEDGLVGMVVSDPNSQFLEGLSTGLIQRAFKIWNLPWDLVPVSSSSMLPVASEKLRVFLFTGDRFMALEEYEKALDFYRKARDLDDRNIETFRRLITAKEKQILSKSSSGAALVDLLTLSYSSYGGFRDSEIEEALAWIYEARARKPSLGDDPELLQQEAYLLMAMNKKDHAVKILEKAHKISPNRVEVLAELGYLLVEHSPEQTARGFDLLHRAIQSRPDAPDYYYYLGQSLEETKQDADAVRTYRRAAELPAPKDSVAEAVRKQSFKRIWDIFYPRIPNSDDPRCSVNREWNMPVDEQADHLDFFIKNSSANLMSQCKNPHLYLSALYSAQRNYQKAVQILEDLLQKEKGQTYYLEHLAMTLEEGKVSPERLKEVRELLNEKKKK